MRGIPRTLWVCDMVREDVPVRLPALEPEGWGADQTLPAGGGNAAANPAVPYSGGDNDDRFMKQVGDVTLGTEGALQYINSVAATQAPFFMIISLVNPHDVLFYPKTFDSSLYPDSDLDGSIQLPSSANDSFNLPYLQRRHRQAQDEHREAPIPQLLRQPDEEGRRLPCRHAAGARGAGAAGRHCGHPYLRSRRDGRDPRQHAPAVVRLLRGGNSRAARLLQPTAFTEAAQQRRVGLPR